MRKTFAYFISILIILIPINAAAQDQPEDSVIIPLKIRAAVEIAGPVIYFINNENLSLESHISGDLNEKMSLFLGIGYANYRYSQYNYNYHSKGIFFKAGVDFNLLKPQTNMGKYWAGFGLHYGLSAFSSETPSFANQNYWGITSSSIPSKNSLGHFLEISPGFRAELFSNFSIGWSVSLRKLIYSGTSKDLMPIYIPGYGNGAKTVTYALNYFISFSWSYKKIKVAVKKEEPEETEETEGNQNISTEGR
jgi:hypothetical protein